MGLIENEALLPGTLTEVTSEYSYGYDTSQFGTTESIVIVGTAFHGPTGAAIAIYSPEHAEYMFGKGYDSNTKKEATLVPAIKDAYEKGCRTIYAVRVSGENAEKDYEFAVDSSLRLRMKAAFPTNDAKEYFLVYDNTAGAEKLKFYKPANRATIVEKRLGLVEAENAVLVNTIELANDYSLDSNSELSEVIDLLNDHQYNNVLRLSIVDESGVEVTTSSEEARLLTLGALLPGLYTIGRSNSICTPVTTLDYKLCIEDEDKPFKSFDGVVYKQIILNTDVSSDYPVFSASHAPLKEILNEVAIFTSAPFDFLETQGLVDRAFEKDNTDYEEVAISNFELYKKLGSGYATTAYAERRVKKDATGKVIKELAPRVKETPLTDANRVQEIPDGIYSVIQNLSTDYRVLAGVGADEEIKDRVPRAKDFQVVSPISANVFSSMIKATPIVNEDAIDNDFVKSYKFEIHEVEEEDTMTASIDSVYTDEVMEVLPLLSYTTQDELDKIKKMNIENGTRTLVKDNGTGKVNLFIYDENNGYRKFSNALLENKLVISDGKIYKGIATDGVVDFQEVAVGDDGFEVQTGETTSVKYQFVLGENNAHVYVFEVLAANLTQTVYADPAALAAGKVVTPLGDAETMFSENEEKTVIYAQSNYFEMNPVIVRSAYMDNLTIEELVEMLNGHSALNHIFTFDMTEAGMKEKDSYLSEIAEITAPDVENPATGEIAVVLFHESVELKEDREIVYNYSQYIPYKTSDNFARQLAQHATYTTLKTGTTHGVIGLKLQGDKSLKGVKAREERLMELDFDLHAKTKQGKPMIGRNSEPYPIGDNVSITEFQSDFIDEDNSKFTMNGAAAYAGMVTVLSKDQSSTNQPIALRSVNYTYSNYQLSRLTQAGFVTVKDTVTNGLVITDGVTMAQADDPMRRLSVKRVLSEVTKIIRAAGDPFIGKPNNDSNRNSLQTAIKSGLESIKGVLIDGYRFTLNTDRNTQKYSYIDIDYAIRPVYEIREIRNRITVQDEI